MRKLRTKITVYEGKPFDFSNEKPEPNPIIPEIIRLRTKEGWSLDRLAHKFETSRPKIQEILWDNDQK